MIHSMEPIWQRESHDCGLACVAMVAGLSYEGARNLFVRKNFHVRRTLKAAYATNFSELSSVLALAGIPTEMKRFREWSSVDALAIMKTRIPNRPKNYCNWHWVVAARRGLALPCGRASIEVFDPARTFPSHEVKRMDAMSDDFTLHEPFGCYLNIPAKAC